MHPEREGLMTRGWRLAWLAVLAALVLLGAHAYYMQSGARQSRLELFEQHLDPSRGGASIYKVSVDRTRLRYSWKPLMVARPVFPRGPLPGKNDYRIAILAGVILESPHVVVITAGSDDGLRLRVDGFPVADTWGQHPRMEVRVRRQLPVGRHLIALDYVQMYGGQVLDLTVTGVDGRPIALHPISPGLDTARWQSLLDAQEAYGKWLKLCALALAGVMLLPLIWLGLRRGPQLWFLARDKYAGAVRGFAAGFLAMLGLALLYYLAKSSHRFVLTLIIMPLAAGLAGAFCGHLLEPPAGARIATAWQKARRCYQKAEPWLLPCLVFAGLLAFVLGWLGLNTADPLTRLLRADFDAHWYRHITAHGYVISRHDAGVLYHTGNYAWFPLLPLIAKLWHLLGLDRFWATLATAWLGALAAFQLIFRATDEISGRRAARWALVALAAWPCSFYLVIAYPYGLAIALGAAYFLALHRERYAWAGLWGLLLGLSYPSAILAGVIPLVMLAPRIFFAERPGRHVWGLLWSGGLLAVGFLALFMHHWLVFDDFWLPLTSQAKWGRASEWPWLTAWFSLDKWPALNPRNLALIFALMITLAFGRRYRPPLWAYAALVLIMGTATGTLICNYRQYLMAWPLFMLLGASSRPAWLKAGFIWLGLFLATRIYLPLWLAGKLP